MSYTFPTDTNNKAGAVKNKAAGNSFVLPMQEEPYDAMEVQRATLVANTDTSLQFANPMDAIDVQNLGAGDIFVRIDSPAQVDGANSILIPEGAGYRFPIKGTVVHVISTVTPKVQAIGFRNA